MGSAENPLLTSFPLFFLFLVLAVAALLLFALIFILTRNLSRNKQPEGRHDKSEVGFVVDTFQDLVSKLKENERELEALRAKAEKRADLIENLSKNILESVPSGVISFNEALEITMVNSSAEKIMGFKREDALGRRHDEVLKGEIARLIEKHETASRQELVFNSGLNGDAKGRRLWVGFSVTPLLDAGGESIGLILVFTDLTELKALERQAELRRRLSSLGEMAAGLAHELRNPMAVISGYSKMLSKRKAPAGAGPGMQAGGEFSAQDALSQNRALPREPAGQELAGIERQAAQAIQKEVAAMDSIINGFLSFANPCTPAFETVDRDRLAALVKKCLDAALAGISSIKASFSAGEGDFVIKADEILLKQVFMNLIQNAVQAMRPEGGQPGPEGGQPEGSPDVPSLGLLDVTVRKKEGEALIAFSDTGPGIPEQMRQKIFLPFYSNKEGGTGLGLAIAHSIIQSHSGSIELENTEKGSTFTVKLPASE